MRIADDLAGGATDMRAVNTYIAATLITAFIMTVIHVAIASTRSTKQHRARPVQSDPLCLSAPSQPLPLVGQAEADTWLRLARRVAYEIGADRDVTVDDIWTRCPAPAGLDGRIIASVFSRSDWEVVDRKKSDRSDVNHGRPIAVWRLKARIAA